MQIQSQNECICDLGHQAQDWSCSTTDPRTAFWTWLIRSPWQSEDFLSAQKSDVQHLFPISPTLLDAFQMACWDHEWHGGNWNSFEKVGHPHHGWNRNGNGWMCLIKYFVFIFPLPVWDLSRICLGFVWDLSSPEMRNFKIWQGFVWIWPCWICLGFVWDLSGICLLGLQGKPARAHHDYLWMSTSLNSCLGQSNGRVYHIDNVLIRVIIYY